MYTLIIIINFICTDKCPEMCELRFMGYQDKTGEEVKVRIIETVLADWVKLADCLGLPAVIARNEQANPGWRPEDACRNVLAKWVDGEGRGPQTWASLLTALREMGGYRAFITKVECALDAMYIG